MRGRWLAALCAVLALLFGALGVWQLERLKWKLDLIERVEARIHAPPSPPPPRASRAQIDWTAEAYRRVTLRGTWLHERETLVQALTELGAGYWVLTPLRTADGVILVNRGFVPPARREPSSRRQAAPLGEVTVTGLLRASEPRAVLRKNDPAADRWYSRDVASIARARGLHGVAPFFVDADNTPNPGGYPIGGLTVVRFRNSHLIYAVTWFALSGLSLFGLVLIVRTEARVPRLVKSPGH